MATVVHIRPVPTGINFAGIWTCGMAGRGLSSESLINHGGNIEGEHATRVCYLSDVHVENHAVILTYTLRETSIIS